MQMPCLWDCLPVRREEVLISTELVVGLGLKRRLSRVDLQQPSVTDRHTPPDLLAVPSLRRRLMSRNELLERDAEARGGSGCQTPVVHYRATADTHRRRWVSGPNGPRMLCAQPTSRPRTSRSPVFVMRRWARACPASCWRGRGPTYEPRARLCGNREGSSTVRRNVNAVTEPTPGTWRRRWVAG